MSHFIVLFLVTLVLFSTRVEADEESSLNIGKTYQEIKTWHEQRLLGNQTNSQKLEDFRSIIRASRYGDRGLNRVFKNFDGKYSIDPSIPGVTQSFRLVASGSKSQAKGYVRELLYATSFHNDPRFELVGMNRVIKRSWGNTDADIIVRHKATGMYARIEVKDVSPSSQSSGIQRIKIQIDKMAREGRLTGQSQFWVNRREVLPEVQRYASSKGVHVFSNVSTGGSQKINTMSSKELSDNIERSLVKTEQNRSFLGGSELVYGVWMLAESASATWQDIQTVSNHDSSPDQAWLRLGQHGFSTLAGGTMALSGSALVASRYAGDQLQSRLYSFGKSGGVVSVGALIMNEGFLISRYRNGDVSSREFWTSQWSQSAATVGTFGGGLLGRVAGTLTPPPLAPLAGNLGSILGGSVGNWAGQYVGEKYAGEYYDIKFAKLDQEFGKTIYDHYKVQ